MSDIFSGLGNLAKSVTSNISSYEIRRITDKMQGMVMNYTEAETQVRDATSEEPWGPTGPQMKEICHLTYQYETFHQVMSMIWKRMLEDNKNAWRRVYKSLVLLNYLLQHGSERVIQSAKDHIFSMRSLENYKFLDEKGRDQGMNVRHRVKVVIDLIQDDDKLRDERKRAKGDNKDKYQGYTKDEIRMGKGGNYARDDEFEDKRSSYDDNARERVAREVNSFSFPTDTRRGSNSPELGWKEEKAEKSSEEDDFGAFTAPIPQSNTTNNNNSRSSFNFSVPPPSAASVVPKAQTTSVTMIGTGLPPIAPPSAFIKPGPPSAENPSTKDTFDLLGLGPEVSPPTAVPPVSLLVDSSPPPALLDDLFGGGAAVDASAGKDIFGEAVAPSFTNNTKAEKHAALFEADWGSASSVASPPFTNVDFAQFDAFCSSSLMVMPATSPVTSQLAPINISKQSTASFSTGSALSPTSAFGGLPLRPASSTTAASAAPAGVSLPSSVHSTPSKIGSTWVNATGLINLDNIASKTPQSKPNIPMNQMGKAGNNNLPW